MLRRTPFQTRFHVLFKVANDHLSHRALLH